MFFDSDLICTFMLYHLYHDFSVLSICNFLCNLYHMTFSFQADLSLTSYLPVLPYFLT